MASRLLRVQGKLLSSESLVSPFASSQGNSLSFADAQDCKGAVSGKSFYAMEGKPVCPKCAGVDDDEEDAAAE